MNVNAWLIWLADWALRAAILISATAALLWILRLKDVHARLTIWTSILLIVLLMPAVGPALPRLWVPIPLSIAEAGSPSVVADSQLAEPHTAAPLFDKKVRPSFLTTDWRSLALVVWFVVALGFLSRLVIGLWLSRRLALRSAFVDLDIRESSLVRVPITVGLFRPVIVLPAGWRSWSTAQREAVLSHERAHVHRRDPLRQLLVAVYCSLCWFHPLAWWLRLQLRELAEAASDDVALAAGGDRLAYAETLLAFFDAARNGLPFHGSAMATPKTRAQRMDRILDETRTLSRPLPTLPAVGTILLSLTAGFLAAAAQPVAKTTLVAQAPRPSPAPQNPTPDSSIVGRSKPAICGGNRAFRAWLNEDVAYIAGPEERRTFLTLSTEKECSNFIEQFWLRRDPTPGTSENEYKKEHYRRIGYANQLYASKDPGWRTDRGRIYIVYGPADEIESHPSGGHEGAPRNYPYEIWRYQRLLGTDGPVTFDFVDTESNRNYRLVSRSDATGKAGTFRNGKGLSVSLTPDRTLLITISVHPGTAGEKVYGRIRARDGRTVHVFEELVKPPQTAFVVNPPQQWEPGVYSLSIVSKSATPTATEPYGLSELAFEVK